MPLEASILAAESRTAGYELQVLVPTDAVKLEIAAADSQQLLNGQWTDAAIEQLATQAIVPAEKDAKKIPPQVHKYNDQVVELEFIDVSRGKLSVWGKQLIKTIGRGL